jgi:Na+-translocating ferredoxin:NAD+ oxidoreductase RnfG subunit
MIKLFLVIIMSTLLTTIVNAQPTKKTIKVKKSSIKKQDLKHVRAINSDQEYYYVELTAEELKIIEEARKAFAEGRTLPHPSQNMIDKMQDQIAPEKEK